MNLLSEVANVMLIGTAESMDSSAHTCTVPSPSVTLSMVGTDTDTPVWGIITYFLCLAATN